MCSFNCFAEQFCEVSEPVYTRIRNRRVPVCVTSSPTLDIVRLFYFIDSGGCVVVLIYISLMENNVKLFICLFAIKILTFVPTVFISCESHCLNTSVFFLRYWLCLVLVQIFCSFLNWVVCLLFTDLKEFLYTMDTSSLTDTWFIDILAAAISLYFFNE